MKEVWGGRWIEDDEPGRAGATRRFTTEERIGAASQLPTGTTSLVRSAKNQPSAKRAALRSELQRRRQDEADRLLINRVLVRNALARPGVEIAVRRPQRHAVILEKHA